MAGTPSTGALALFLLAVQLAPIGHVRAQTPGTAAHEQMSVARSTRIVADPTVDFAALYAGVDTVLLGRRTYELTQQPGAPPWPIGWRISVFSRTLDPAETRGVTVISRDSADIVASLRSEPGQDIWLFGGGNLFASLLAAALVDQIEVASMPVLLAGGIRLVSIGVNRSGLTLTGSHTSLSGVVSPNYEIQHPAG